MKLLNYTSDPNDTQGIIREFREKTGISPRSLALQFDTLGCDCCLGFIQRWCDSEPLSLLRFSHISLPKVIKGINTDFAGLSDPEQLVAIRREDGEWDMHQRLYDMNWHTFLRWPKISQAELLSKQAKSLEFLRRKLLSDIADGSKTFVVWQTERPLAENEVVPLFSAIRRRGRSRLLWVVQDSPCGMVEEVLPGLMRGRIDIWSWMAGPDNLKYSLGGWLNVLMNAFELGNGILSDIAMDGTAVAKSDSLSVSAHPPVG